MSFIRRPAGSWRRDVPGARWFKADLHIHTIDDRAGGRAKMPEGLTGDPASPGTLELYARSFLQALVDNCVQVAGLTPHSPRAGDGPETSAVWRIVEEWNKGTDDDGTPFREKIFAVFPGFEPSFRDGRSGLHLLFLFDPEIGRERYLTAFDLVMGGISPWKSGGLQVSNRNARQAFTDLREFREQECPADGELWDYLTLAPHIELRNGLLGAQQAQVLERFDHGAIAGLELGDDKLPEDTLRGRGWLRHGMQTHRQAFFHASDAYTLDHIGRRHTWMKLAAPRIEGLRQAFVASDSRVRLGFERGEDGTLGPVAPPDASLAARPWLREVTIGGGASFFGGETFRLSPDLTCIVGGSMTGKSTFLDGLRVFAGAPLPDDDSVRANVEARGRNFAAGAAEIAVDCPGRDPTASLGERWPARFFAQNELQRLSQGAGAVEEILARSVPSEIEGIERRARELRGLDERLSDAARQLDRLDERAAEAEQAHERADSARRALEAFAEAGVERLRRAGREREAWHAAHRSAADLRKALRAVLSSARDLDVPQVASASEGELASDLAPRWQRIAERIEAAVGDVDGWVSDACGVLAMLTKKEAELRAEVERALAARGFDAAKLREFQDLDRQASLLPRYAAVLDETRRAHAKETAGFARLQDERRALVDEQRTAFDRVAAGLEQEFGNRIRVRRANHGDTGPLDRFLVRLRQRGVTRWWNEMPPDRKPSPGMLADRLVNGSLGKVGMSGAVQETFRESMTRSRRRQLAALRCPDRYDLELRMDDGKYRPLRDLSGGQRVSVLLSLLLETADDRPLVIDQPEDELDNRFLSGTVLPALRKLRGRRQVVLATHDANIVVNGDADMAIQLEATASRGRVACAGTIEEPAVRDAIVRTVDGGEEAFRLRRRKYGF